MEKASCRFPDWVSTKIVGYYAEQGIKYLFDWQRKVLQEAGEYPNQHLIFSAPTSAGKSIVAELLAWRVASTGKKVLFVLPYISVAREKLHQIQRCWRRDDIAVAGFIGPQASNPNEWIGAVCTIEKAGSLTNRALSESWFQDIGMIVVDEMHMVFDSSRGAHIEHMLSKVLLWNKENSPENQIRIVGMSATIPELHRLGQWLEGTKVCEAEFRPISLNNNIITGGEDSITNLALESFRENTQTLIMISSKLDAEKTALSIATKFHELKKSDPSMMDRLKDRADGLHFIRNGLERHGCKDRNVMAALAWGVAYHHAGLTMEERECLEVGFREKSIIILVATSTLASGVNLPAERVIIKAQTRGPSALTSLSYRQMVGRAGRTGHATRGESFLIVKKCDEEAVRKILDSPIDQVIQVKNREKDRTSLSRFILEGICTGLTTTKARIDHLCSLLLFPSTFPDHSLEMLLQNSFISLEDDLFSPTQLGRAALASSLPPEASLAIFEDLNSASRAIAVDTELHMLYLVTPINVTVWQECDWHHLFALFSKLPSDHRRIAKMVGVSEKFILDQLQGRRNQKMLQVHVRFFSALALFDLINEMSIYQVSQKYRIPRGCLQTLQSQSATYAAMIVAFCLRLGWTYLKALLDGFAMRLLFGIRSELSELVAIEGVDGQRARILHERGITCLSHLSACDSSKLAHFLTLAVPYSRSNCNDGLGEWLFGEPRMKLSDAARILKERARAALMRRIQELGITVELPKVLEEEKEEEEKENQPESCDSGLPDSCDIEEESGKEQDVKSLNEMTQSVSEMSLTSSEDDFFKEEVNASEDFTKEKEEADEIVEDTIIDDLDTSLLKMKAPKDQVFIRRLSMTFSPAALRNSSMLEDSFDKPVPGSIPWSLKTPKRDFDEGPKTSTPQFEDSFDRPVPGSVPFGFAKKQMTPVCSIRRDSFDSIASENKSFDVFSTPPIKDEKPRMIGKHSRSVDFIDSPLSSMSPVVKHAKLESDKFQLKDWETWMKTASKSSYFSLSLLDSGVAIGSANGTTFFPLTETFDGASRSDPRYFGTLSKCTMSLETRIKSLKKLFSESQPIVYLKTMNDSFDLFEKFGIQISKVKILQIAAHLNHLIEPETEVQLFPMLLEKDPDTLKLYSTSSNIHKSIVEVFEMKRIFEELQKMSKRFTSEKSFNLEMDSCQSVLNMHYAGIFFDSVACKSFISETRKRIEKLEEQIWRLAHGKFNIDSSNEVANVLFHRLGLVYPESSGCKPKQRHFPTNKQILEQMTNQHQIVEKILEYRHMHHTLTQCLLPLAKYEKNRIHCRMETCTATGRMLTSEPNLQNVPKRVSSDGLSARQLLKPSPGNILIGADYKQLELRVLAHLCNDSKLLNFIREDRDLFGELSTEWGFSRDVVKQLCYGLIYGMGAKTLAELTRVKVEEAERMLASFFAMFPGVRSYINEVKEKVSREEQVQTILGRKKLIQHGVTGEEKARAERVAVNFTVQGSASEIFKTAMVSMERRFKAKEARIVLTIHDEVLVECTENRKSEIQDIIRETMQSALSDLLRVPMKISLKTGRSWAELK